MKMLVIPIVNINGDKITTLLDEFIDIRAKLSVATQALKNASYANARNYQLNPEGDAQEALSQHNERVEALERVAQELLDIAYDISNISNQEVD